MWLILPPKSPFLSDKAVLPTGVIFPHRTAPLKNRQTISSFREPRKIVKHILVISELTALPVHLRIRYSPCQDAVRHVHTQVLIAMKDLVPEAITEASVSVIQKARLLVAFSVECHRPLSKIFCQWKMHTRHLRARPHLLCSPLVGISRKKPFNFLTFNLPDRCWHESCTRQRTNGEFCSDRKDAFVLKSKADIMEIPWSFSLTRNISLKMFVWLIGVTMEASMTLNSVTNVS